MERYKKTAIRAAHDSALEQLANIRPGQKLLFGYAYYPYYFLEGEEAESQRAYKLLEELEDAGRILRFVVREGTGRFAYVALGVTPQVIQQVEAIAASVELPPILREITRKYSQSKR